MTNLSALHDAVRETMRRGTTSPIDAVAHLSKAESRALRAWRRRLQACGKQTTALIPPATSYEWLVPAQRNTAT